MASIALERTDVIVGVNTHKDQHAAVTLDGLGGRLRSWQHARLEQRTGSPGRMRRGTD